MHAAGDLNFKKNKIKKVNFNFFLRPILLWILNILVNMCSLFSLIYGCIATQDQAHVNYGPGYNCYSHLRQSQTVPPIHTLFPNHLLKDLQNGWVR